MDRLPSSFPAAGHRAIAELQVGIKGIRDKKKGIRDRPLIAS
jgi:hypothetical protein